MGTMTGRRRILAAMSGGVDSAVAAALLAEAGHEVVGVFMCLNVPRAEGEPGGRTCCSPGDAADARAVAVRLGIPFHVLNFQGPFDRLIDHFVAEYNRGRTPNPCIRCNSELKFGRLVEYADAIGAEAVATGHYARIVETPAGPRLARGADPAKDQSYVLFAVSPATVGRMVLPLGEWTKDRVRAKAAELGLAVADKPDSQEICFVPDDDYAALVRRRTPGAVRPGEVLDAAGMAIGTHPGHQHFTIGQRRGLGIAAGSPVYVTAIDPVANTVTVGPAEALLRGELTCSNVNWLIDCERASGEKQSAVSDEQSAIGDQGARITALVKVRYRAEAALATVFPLPGRRARAAGSSSPAAGRYASGAATRRTTS